MAAAAAVEWSLVPRPGASDAGASKALERAQRAGVTKTVLARGAARRRARFGGPESLTEVQRALKQGELVRVEGSTRAAVVAQSLGLRPGQPFRWDGAALKELQAGGPFEFVEPHASLTSKTADGGGEVVVRVEALERGHKPGQRATHRNLEPSVAVSSGGVSGELMLEDSNFCGRNQRVRLDLSVHNTTDIKLRLSDPRLGRLLRVSASAFSRPSADAYADAAEPTPNQSPLAAAFATHFGGRNIHSGGEMRVSGIGLRTTLGLGASVQRVPAALARSPGGSGQGPSEIADANAAELPVEVGLHLAHGSLREDSSPADGGVSASFTHTLPIAAASPRFWRLQCRAVRTTPLTAALGLAHRPDHHLTSASPRPWQL